MGDGSGGLQVVRASRQHRGLGRKVGDSLGVEQAVSLLGREYATDSVVHAGLGQFARLDCCHQTADGRDLLVRFVADVSTEQQDICPGLGGKQRSLHRAEGFIQCAHAQ